MKTLIASISLLFLSIFCYAQKPILSKDFSFQIGEKYKETKNLQSYYYTTSNFLAAFKKGRDNMTIQRFSLDNLKENIKDRQVIDDKGDFQTIMKLGVRGIIFYSVKNKAYAQGVSITGKVADKPVLLANDSEEIHYDFGFKSTYGFDAGGRIHQFGFKKSFNGTKLLVVYRIQTPGDQPDKIGVNVYDAGLELVWKKKIQLPHPSDRMENEDFAIDNEGTFYMTASVFNSEDDKKNKIEASYSTEIYKLAADQEELIKDTIDLGNNAVTNAVLGLDRMGGIALTGFFANNTDKIEASGIFSARIGPEGKIVNVIKTKFPDAEVAKYQAQRESRINEGTQNKKDKKDFEELRVNEVVYNANGSFVVLGEQRFVESFTTSSSSGSRTTYIYYYKHIAVFKSSSEGKMIWMHLLPKDQFGVRGKASMSYYHFFDDNKHYLLHIDHFANLKREFQEASDRYNDGKKDFLYLVSYTIDDATGEVIKEPILTGRDVRNSRLDRLKVSKAALMATNNDLIFEVNDGKKNDLLLKLSKVERE